MNPRVKEFIDRVVELEKQFGLSIAHEDIHGGFLIEKYSEANVDWLRDASIRGGLGEEKKS